MSTVTLVAVRAFPYAGQPVVPGEVFVAAEHDARVLKIIGHACDAVGCRDTEPDFPDELLETTS